MDLWDEEYAFLKKHAVFNNKKHFLHPRPYTHGTQSLIYLVKGDEKLCVKYIPLGFKHISWKDLYWKHYNYGNNVFKHKNLMHHMDIQFGDDKNMYILM